MYYINNSIISTISNDPFAFIVFVLLVVALGIMFIRANYARGTNSFDWYEEVESKHGTQLSKPTQAGRRNKYQ
jgi:hypothetical protein